MQNDTNQEKRIVEYSTGRRGTLIKQEPPWSHVIWWQDGETEYCIDDELRDKGDYAYLMPKGHIEPTLRLVK